MLLCSKLSRAFSDRSSSCCSICQCPTWSVTSNPTSFYSPPCSCCSSQVAPSHHACSHRSFSVAPLSGTLFSPIITWLTPSLSSRLYSNISLGEPPRHSTLAMSTVSQCMHIPPHLAPLPCLPFFILTCCIFYIALWVIICPSVSHIEMWSSVGQDFVCFVNCFICYVYVSTCLYSTYSVNSQSINLEVEGTALSWLVKMISLVPFNPFTQVQIVPNEFSRRNYNVLENRWFFYLLSDKNPELLQFYDKDSSRLPFQEKVHQTRYHSYLILYYLCSEPLRFQPPG